MFLQVCPVCEHRNPRGSRFCNECGSPLQLRFCPACHAAEDVMSLECRACGARLPLLALTDRGDDAAAIAPNPENIFKSDAAPTPVPDFDADEHVTVHGGGSPAVALDMSAPASDDAVESAQPANAHATSDAPAPEPAPEPVRRKPAKAKKLTVIEQLHKAQLDARTDAVADNREPATTSNVDANAVPETSAAAAAPVEIEAAPAAHEPEPIAEQAHEPQDAALEDTPLLEDADDFDVAAETEARDESDHVVADYPQVDEIAIPQRTQMDELAKRLREGAWRTAMSVDPGPGTALVTTWSARQRQPIRRLSMHRVGLAVAAMGALVALVYSVRLAPGTTEHTTATSVEPTVHSAALPIRKTQAVPAVAAGVAAVPPAESAVPAPEAVADPMPPPIAISERAREKPAEVTLAPTKQDPASGTPPKVAPVRRAPPPPATPPPAIQAEALVTAPAQARHVPAEPPRPCTAAIAALGLCTLPTTEETK